MRTTSGQRWKDTRALPRPAWHEDAELAAWRSHAGRSRRRDDARARPTRLGTVARAVTGSLAAGLLLLALFLIGTQVWALGQGLQGPGIPTMIGHIVAAVVALVLQAIADRRRDAVGGVAAIAVLILVFGALWFWWWA
jgi:hypothetical protein